MKAKIVPTSPKNQQKETSDDAVEAFLRTPSPITKPSVTRFSAGFLITIIVLSFVAGVVGALTVVVGRDQWPWLQKLIGSGQTVTTVVTPVTKREAPTEQYADTVRTVQKNVVAIFSRRTPLKKNPSTLDQLYLPADFRGVGTLLTEDGIGVTTRAAIPDLTKEVAVVTADHVVYTTKDFTTDPASDLVYFRISGKGFPVLDFADPAGLLITQRLVAVGMNPTSVNAQALPAFLTNLAAYPVADRTSFLRSSERFIPSYLTDASGDTPGQPLFTIGGKLVGTSVGTGNQVIPVSTIASGLQRLQQTGKVTRNVLGVRYLDLDVAQSLIVSTLSAGAHGALLMDGGTTQPAVIAKSPAARAGLLAGDVITKVNDQTLSSSQNLTDLIQAVANRGSVTITYKRGTTEQNVPITLDVTQ